MLITSEGAFTGNIWIFVPPYFRAPKSNPANIHPNALLFAINATAIPSKP